MSAEEKGLLRRDEMVLVLDRTDLMSIVDMKDAIDSVERAFAEFARGTVKLPIRSIINIEQSEGYLLLMPAYLSKAEALCTKIVSVFPSNINRGLPTVLATVILSDPATGRTLALIEGSYLTALRTGAASGVATRYLSREDSRVVGLIGAGVQGRTQLWAVCEVRDIERAQVFDIEPEKANRFADEMSRKLGIEITTSGSSRDAVKGADIVITATTSKLPVLDGEWIDPGTHINAIGSFRPDIRELDSKTVMKAKIFVDSCKAALEEAGDLLIPMAEGLINKDTFTELGEVVISLKSGRVSDQEVTLWKSVGLGIQDAAVAKLAFDKALKIGAGRRIDF